MNLVPKASRPQRTATLGADGQLNTCAGGRAQSSTLRTVSLKTLARELDAHRSSVRRWLRDADIRPISLGQSRKGAIRYLWSEVEAWLLTRERVE